MKSATKFPWLYLLLAYGWAWLWWIPIALSKIDYQSSPLLILLVLIGVFGPGLAGIFLTYRSGNPEERGDFWQRAFDIRRVQWRWIVLMLLLWPAMHLLGNLLSTALGSPPPASELLAQIAGVPPFALVVVVLYFLQAALEDLGWRGYVQQKLLRSYSPVHSALIVGAFHAFWHLPLFFVVGSNQAQMGLGLNFWLFVAQAVAFSLYATWCYLDNRNSTLAAILLHTVGNLCNDIFTLQGGTLKFELHTFFMVVGALAISLIWLRPKSTATTNENRVTGGLMKRFTWFLLFVAVGLLVFFVFSHYYPLFSGNADIIGRVVLGAALLGLALLARRSERFHKYWLLPCAFFTALVAISIDKYLSLSKLLLPAFGIAPSDTPSGWAIDKLESSLLGVAVVLVVNGLWGNRLGSIFWRRGRLGLGLAVGLIVFALMLAVVIPFTTFAFKGQNLTWERILTWLPWLLIFVLANGFAEETIFRGVFLGRLQPFVGAFAANVATAIPFTLSHAPIEYASDQLYFLGATFLLALAWGWLMQKTQSLWGSVLFHAAMDIPIIAGIFSGI